MCILSPLNQLTGPAESIYWAHWVNLPSPLSQHTQNTLSKAVLQVYLEPTESTYWSHWGNLPSPLNQPTKNTLSKAIPPCVPWAHWINLPGLLNQFIEPTESTYQAHWVNIHRTHWVKPSPRCILSPPNLLTDPTEATYRAYWINLHRTHWVKLSPRWSWAHWINLLSPLNQLMMSIESTYREHTE